MQLIEYLSKAGMSASAFAQELGVWPSTVTRWMRDGRAPRREMLRAITRATGGAVKAGDFFDDPPKRRKVAR